MRIVIDMGHTPTSPGASGYIDELTEDRRLGALVIAELQARGHEVYNSTPADWVAYPEEVNERCAYTNALGGVDLFCSIHFNAFNGAATGTEVLHYYADPTGEAWASLISSNVASCLGITNRGAKANDWVGVIVNTNPTAVLIETCFCDNYGDCTAYWNTDINDIVDAICDGIEWRTWEKRDHAPQPEPEPTPEPEPEPAPKPEPLPDSDISSELAKIRGILVELDAKIRELQATQIDYAALAKAVNDDAAARMSA